MSTIAAGTTSGTALVSTGNTDGTIQLQVNGTTPSVTLATTGAIGVGSTPGYGTSGQVLTSGGSSAAPSWSTVSSVPTFTATGAISAAGISVALNSDGTVTQISGTTTSFSVGSGTTLPSTRTGDKASAAYDPVNQKVLLVAQYSSFLMGYVGTVSGTTITFGSEFQINSVSTTWSSVAYDTVNAKFMVSYVTANTLRGKVLTISGTSITAGTETTFTNSAGYTGGTSIAYSPVAGKFIIMGCDGSPNTSFWLATISGTSITENFSPSAAMLTNFLGNAISCNPATGTVALAGRSAVVGATYPYLYVVSVTSTTVTVGGGLELATAAAQEFTTPIFFGSTTAGYGLAVVYQTTGTNNAILMKAGAEINGSFVLGGTYAYGSNYSASRTFVLAENTAGSNIVIAWGDGNSGYAISLTAVVNPNGSVVFGSANNLFTPTNSGNSPGLAYNAVSGAMVYIGGNNSNSRYTVSVFVPDGFSSNAQSFIGLSTASAASGATVGVSMFANMNTNQTSLTLGSRYYVSYTGSVTTTNSGFPYAGRSYGTTKIFVGV